MVWLYEIGEIGETRAVFKVNLLEALSKAFHCLIDCCGKSVFLVGICTDTHIESACIFIVHTQVHKYVPRISLNGYPG